MPPSPSTNSIILIGLRRSGKTSVGRALATRLALPFVDLDELIAAREHADPGAIILAHGEPAFRIAETAALRAVAADERTVILACGGGTPENTVNQEILRTLGTILYLDLPIDVLTLRAQNDPDFAQRPLLAGADPAGDIRILHERRDPLYRRLADRVISGDGDLDAVVARCVAAVQTPPTE